MVNVRDRRCKEQDCNKLPIYGIDIGKYLYCNLHKKEGMFVVKAKYCEFKDCKIQASFGKHCKIQASFGKHCKIQASFGKNCKIHNTEQLSNTTSKKCEFDNCIIRPVFGYVKNKPINC